MSGTSKSNRVASRQTRKAALLQAAQRWRGVASLNRSRGQISNAQDEERIAQRIMVAFSLLANPSLDDRITDDFIVRHSDKSANEFVAELVGLFGGKLPGAPASPGDIKRKVSRRRTKTVLDSVLEDLT